MSKGDGFGDRMKNLEFCYRFMIPKKSYVCIRLDGKSFHTFTKGLDRPFDKGLMDDMDSTTKYLCENISGCKIGYTQSDEITLILSDKDSIETEPWFGNNLQKLCSVAASMCTAKFNQLRRDRWYTYGTLELNPEPYSEHKSLVYKRQVETLAFFDARVFVLPNEADVYSVLQWRSNDASRNSVSSVAQSLYSHKELHGKSNSDMQEMIFQKGINWNDYSYREKRGGTFAKVEKEEKFFEEIEESIRKYWSAVETPMNWFDDRSRIGI